MLIRFFKRVWAGWKRVAGVIGRFQTRIILTVFYFVVAGPAWVLIRLFDKDMLARRRGGDLSYWIDGQPPGDETERARRQF
ncbi:MAG TPA: hypothetical protein VF131_19265 [Blastocatellia bacterium]|nr:hypothetical protein [Blastocatellia bacterium]